MSDQSLQEEFCLAQRLLIFNSKSLPFKFIKGLNYQIFGDRTTQIEDPINPSVRQQRNKGTAQDQKTSIEDNTCPFDQNQIDYLLQKKEQIKTVKKRRIGRLAIEKKIATEPFEGKGVTKLGNRNVVFATWINGIVQGKVQIIYKDGSTYTGFVKQYLRHGQGILFFQNGEEYKGSFNNGRFDGFGTLRNNYGEIIDKGIWKMGNLIQTII